MKMKKIISIITAVTTTAALAAGFAPIASAATYSDVDPSHWAYEKIKTISDRGIFNGYEDGTFRPSNPMTHEEFVKTIIELVAPNSVTPVGANYTQVNTNDSTNPQYWSNRWSSWAQCYLTKALELGIIGDGSQASNEKIATLLDCYDEAINGVLPDGNYHNETLGMLPIDFNDTANVTPSTPITREEAARIVTRALYLLDEDGMHEMKNTTNGSATYKKAYNCLITTNSEGTLRAEQNTLVFARPEWGINPKYRRDALVAYNNGIISYDEKGLYNPQNSLTRAEAATIVLRLIDENQRIAHSYHEAWMAISDVYYAWQSGRHVASYILTAGYKGESLNPQQKIGLANLKYSSVWVEPCMRTYLAEHPEYNTVAALTEALAIAHEKGNGACAPIVQKLLDEAIAAQ